MPLVVVMVEEAEAGAALVTLGTAGKVEIQVVVAGQAEVPQVEMVVLVVQAHKAKLGFGRIR